MVQPQLDTDRNLIIGILAVQFRFISKDQLLQVLSAWLLNKSQTFDHLLLAQGALTSATHAKLMSLVEIHLEQHAQDAHESMVALDAASSIRHQIERLGDRDLEASMGIMPRAISSTYDATRALPAQSEISSRYQIVRPHAKGGLGEVFVARDAEFDREVALKEIQLQFASQKECQDRFVLEAQITGGLEHPGIVPVYGLGKYPDGRAYYAMRFIRGESLNEALDRFHQEPSLSASEKSLRLRQFLANLIDVCNTIEYAHSKQVLHRDIKPSNIMLGKFGETLVVDWGLAKVIAASENSTSVETPLSVSGSANGMLTSMGTLVGTPQFMSPEQALGQVDRITPASDVYSLGATMYYLLTGTPPVTEKELGVILQKVRQGDIPPAHLRSPTVPRSLSAICTQAMALAPSQRYASARMLATEIERWLADEPVAAYQESGLEKFSRWAKRNRAWTRAAMVSTFAIACVAVVSLFFIQRARRNELTALEQATRGQAAAEAGFLQARTAVDDFFTRISETKLLKVPGLQPLRKELLAEALRYYQRFLREHGNKATLQSETAATHFRIGVITAEIGKKSEALASLQKALDMQKALVLRNNLTEQSSESASIMSYRVAVANTLNALGSVHIDLGDPSAALAWFQQAKDHRQIVANDAPGDASARRKLLNSYDNLAVAQAMLGAKSDAIRMYEQANIERARLMADQPQELMYRYDLARGYFNLATLRQQQAEYATAWSNWRQAIELYEQLQRQEPNVLEYSRELAVANASLAECEFQLAKYNEAHIHYLCAVELLDSLILKHPQVSELLLDSAKVQLGLAIWHAAQREEELSLEKLAHAQRTLQTLLKIDNELFSACWELANVMFQRGRTLQKLMQWEQAQTAYQQAIEQYRRCLQVRHSDRVALNSQLVLVYAALANNYLNQKQPEEAWEACVAGEKIGVELLRLSPQVVESQLLLVEMRKQMALIRMEQEQWSEAEKIFTQLITTLTTLQQQSPERWEIMTALADAYSSHAQLWFWQNRMDAALKTMQHCIAWRTKVAQRPHATFNDSALWAEAVDTSYQISMAAGDSATAQKFAEEAQQLFNQLAKQYPQTPELDSKLNAHYQIHFQAAHDAGQYASMLQWGQRIAAHPEGSSSYPIALSLAEAFPEATKSAAESERATVAKAWKELMLLCLRQSIADHDPDTFTNEPRFQMLHAEPKWQELLKSKPKAK